MSFELIESTCPVCGHSPIRKYTFGGLPDDIITHAYECPVCDWLAET